MKNTTTLITMAVLLSACAGQADLPTVTTDEVTAITYNSATVNATVTDDGGAPIEARGVCYSTSQQPSLDNGTCTSNDRGTGSFSAEINNLSTNTTYYTRAYATNSEGTGYGRDIEYVTQINGSVGTPQIISGPITDITYTTATCQGSVSGFGSPIQMKGICWSTQPNPTINHNYQEAGSGEGNFTLTMEGLDAGTSYYVKTYCLVNADTLYGNEVEFQSQNYPFSYTTGEGVTDIDGNYYPSVIMNGTEWMSENLRVSRFVDGTPIAHVPSESDWTLANDQLLGVDLTPIQLVGCIYQVAESIFWGDSCSGAAWDENSLDLFQSFDVSINFRFNDTDDRGIALVFQTVGTGALGNRLGYEGITPSLAVHIDNHFDSNENDPSFDHVSLMANGSVMHNTGNELAGPAQALVLGNPLIGAPHYLRVRWNAASSTMDIYIDGSQRLSYSGNLIQNIFSGNSVVFIGVTMIGRAPSFFPLWLQDPSLNLAWCNLNNSQANDANGYGKLYNQWVITSETEVCPAGWHKPTYNDWTDLISLLGGNDEAAEFLMSPNWGNGLNASGFNAVPSGKRDWDGSFYSDIASYAAYWNVDEARAFSITNSTENAQITLDGASGNSIRCVKD